MRLDGRRDDSSDDSCKLHAAVSVPQFGLLKSRACAVAGSLCISYTIKTFGALVFATIMTTRQFLSILLSAVVFRSPLTPGQW